MNNQPILGQIIEDTAERDAIHIAIAPVVAAGRVYPGQHVALLGNGPQVAAVLPTDPNRPIGIVDPFLTHPVEAGTKFYLFLYPQTVTGLRHEWTHPAFDAAPDKISHKSGWQPMNKKHSFYCCTC